MQIDDNLWLYDGFYVDIDELGQLRIAGPNNHLYFGSVGIAPGNVQVSAATMRLKQLRLEVRFKLDDGFLADPAMGHIRQVREQTQIFGEPTRSFSQVNLISPGMLAPMNISAESDEDRTVVRYSRSYGEHYYGLIMTFPAGVSVHREELRHGFVLQDAGDTVSVTIDTDSDDLPEPYAGKIFSSDEVAEPRPLWDRTTAEINHLIRGRKTSGFDYGTVFPRDWMETADLIADELTDETFRFMYSESLRHVSEQGAGWHEDIVGEFSYERRQEIERLSSGFDMFIDPSHPASPQFRRLLEQLDELFVTRMMIDIEPHYIMGLSRLKFEDFDEADQIRLRHVAHFIIKRADAGPLITFNKLALPFKRHRGDEYYSAGNWRDSLLAYQRVGPVIAPYDVNAVFYPQALKLIATHAEALSVDPGTAERLRDAWADKDDLFRFVDRQGISQMALALYADHESPDSDEYKQLRVGHTDEAYACLYGQPHHADVMSFARRVVSPEYFYTASGPLVVAAGHGYDHSLYHGEVIWTKQTAFIVKGLLAQLRRAQDEGWEDADELRVAIRKTADASLSAFQTLSSIPELHFDDGGVARHYNDQPHPEGQVNTVQLWSAAGARIVMKAATKRA